jgi:hypothetical protein
MTWRACPWCCAANRTDPGRTTHCSRCGHRADSPARSCNCPACRRRGVPRDRNGRPVAVGDTASFDEASGAVTSGVVRVIAQSHLGPVASVEYARGQRFEILCRHLRVTRPDDTPLPLTPRVGTDEFVSQYRRMIKHAALGG